MEGLSGDARRVGVHGQSVCDGGGGAGGVGGVHDEHDRRVGELGDVGGGAEAPASVDLAELAVVEPHHALDHGHVGSG